uniref:Uncharacterized protein n=1 Tax=Chryseobacterium endophyticum TaxID=1854762 RepID=A0AAU6WML3_9FLAO
MFTKWAVPADGRSQRQAVSMPEPLRVIPLLPLITRAPFPLRSTAPVFRSSSTVTVMPLPTLWLAPNCYRSGTDTPKRCTSRCCRWPLPYWIARQRYRRPEGAAGAWLGFSFSQFSRQPCL